MDSLFAQIEALAVQADTAGRHKVLDLLRSLQLKLETPHDTLSRLSGLHLEITAARIAQDLEIFQALAEAKSPMTAAELAAKKNASPLLLASVGMIRESGPDSFTASEITLTLAQPGYRGGVYHFFDNCGPVFQALSSFLAETKYQDVTDAAHTAFQKAFPTDLPAFMWLPTQPERFGPLQQAMTVQGAVGTPWFTVFPFGKEVGDFGGEHVFVDVGGGFGHQSAALLGAFPHLKGKLVLQDLPQTLEHLPPGVVIPDGIQKLPHDFFTEQPIKGARFYYLRQIIHDWPDDKCVEILKHLVAASGPESQILIDDMVLPDSGVPWEAATVDLTIMASLGSRERTLKEWYALLDQAGLKALHVYTYQPRRQDSIIQAVPK
ncbi:hypothetical protein INS49_013278 [Diaporthe citri]|uniref:uncharacterized protein n=1 Tax=Diaporthe citri TaxID=83186 RepID=UPI001C8144F6|nr:uncharacterized protein INS49_013278 [Diaporthe citri]KAG6357401.1 hypothetical protein INS49_013278 [Diaporthe citri]